MAHEISRRPGRARFVCRRRRPGATGGGVRAQDLKYSDHWQAKLEEAQLHMLRTERALATPQGRANASLKHLLRHFSFAPQLFESFCGPRVKYAW